MIRHLNNDGVKLYNVTIDTVQESSPWLPSDEQLGINPDLYGVITDDGHFSAPVYKQGKGGYRMDALIRIGENFWFDPKKGPAKQGDTYGITIRNLSCHSCAALAISCTLQDSLVENVRIFGNGTRAVLCNDGILKNITFRDICYTEECMPHREDEHIHIDWNATDAYGFSAVYFNRTTASGLFFANLTIGRGMTSVFDGI